MKTGLIVEGGGMKCAYSAGVLDGFLDQDAHFDYAIGVSAGSGNTASFLAGQRERNLRFFTTHTESPDYFGMKSFCKTGDLFNLNYIYGKLTNSDGDDPLDYESLMADPTEFYIVATDAETGQPCYFPKEQLRKNDFREFMASSAIPAACRPVALNGHLYYDGGVSDPIPVERACRDGCRRLVIILSKTRDYVKKPESHRTLYHLLCRKYPNIVSALDQRHITYTMSQREIYSLEADGHAMVFAPETLFDIGTYSTDPGTCRSLYELGLRDAQARREELEKFLEV